MFGQSTSYGNSALGTGSDEPLPASFLNWLLAPEQLRTRP